MGLSRPLVSVVMPTWNRPRLAEHAVELMLAQTYKNLEILILDDSDPWCLMRIPKDGIVKHVRLPEKLTLGEKWALGDKLANGEIVVHWDDDDWYPTSRLVRQLEPIILGEADLSAFGMGLVLTLPDCRFWRFKRNPSRILGSTLHDGTIAYRRGALRSVYPASSIGEQTVFVNGAIRQGARVREIFQTELFVYVRHGSNAWKFDAASRLLEAPAPRWFPREELAFYRMAVGHVA